MPSPLIQQSLQQIVTDAASSRPGKSFSKSNQLSRASSKFTTLFQTGVEFRFGRASYSVSEGEEQVVLQVNKEGITSETLSVVFQTLYGTASSVGQCQEIALHNTTVMLIFILCR